MDAIRAIINMVTRNCFMTTTDLKDAYYSIAISRQFQKLLKYNGKINCTAFCVFQMVLGLAQENSTN